MRIKFSVIIPTFNREKLLIKALNSVLSQNYQNFEIIIVDNFSTDQTEKNIKLYTQKYKFIKFYRYANNNIIASSRNYGASKATGEYLCFLDSDDYWSEDKLKIIYQKILHQNEKLDLIYHDMKFENKVKIFNIRKKIKSSDYNNNNWYKLITSGNKITTSSVTVKKLVFEKLGGFNIDSRLVSCEDLDLWIRILKYNCNSYHIKKVLGTYVSHSKNFSINNSYKPFLTICKKYCREFPLNEKNILYSRRIYIGKLYKLNRFFVYALKNGDIEIKIKLILKYIFIYRLKFV